MTPTPDAAPPDGSLASRTRLGILVNAGFNIFRDVAQFLVMIVMVRITPPEAYGQFGVTMALTGFINTFASQNYLTHFLQERDAGKINYQHHFTAGVVIQIGLFIATNIAAVVLARMPAYKDIALVVHLFSISFLLEAVANFHVKRLERDLHWPRLRGLHAIGLLISSLMTIALGLLGYGVYALALPGMLVTLPFAYDLFVIQKWRPDWSFSWAHYKPIMHFGLWRTASGLSSSVRTLSEMALLSAAVGFASLGVLNRASGLATLFCSKIASQLMYVLFPVLARFPVGSPQFKNVSGLILRVVNWSVVFLAGGMAIVSDSAVRIVYGSGWSDVVPLLPLTMTTGAMIGNLHAGSAILLSSGRPRWCLGLDLAALVGVIATAWVLPRFGLWTYAAGACALHVVLISIAHVLLLRADCVDTKALRLSLVPCLISGSLALCAAYVAGRLGANWGSFARDVCAGVAFGLMYILALRAFFERALSEVVSYLPGQSLIRRVLKMEAPQSV